MGCPASGVAHSADRTDVEVVVGQCVEAGNSDRTGIYGELCARRGSANKALRAIFDLPFRGRSDIDPVNGEGRGGGMGGRHIAWSHAGGGVVEGEIIGVGTPVAGGTVGLDSHILSIASICRQRDIYLPPVGAPNKDGIDTYECSQVVGVGHDTYLKCRIGGGRRCLSPERQLQGADIDSGVDGWQNGTEVIAVGACGGRVVPVKSFAAAGSVVVGAATHIGIATRTGAVVEAYPAVNKGASG